MKVTVFFVASCLLSILTGLARAFGRGDPLEQKSITLTDPAALALFGVQPVASGMTITAASDMRVPAVRRAVSLIAESVACLPFKVYEQDSREAATGHPAFSLVHDHANDWTSAEAFREHLTADALLTGHGYAQVARNAKGKPVFMLRMDPAAVTVECDDFGEPSYRVRLKSGGEQVLPFQDVLHIQPLHGVSPITLAREAIGLALAAEQHLAGFCRTAPPRLPASLRPPWGLIRSAAPGLGPQHRTMTTATCLRCADDGQHLPNLDQRRQHHP